MAEKDLEDLKNECKETTASSDPDRIAEGAGNLFVGRPVASVDGTIALSISETVTLVLRAEDVLDATKQGDAYLVRARSDADVLFRQEVVLPARRTETCECTSNEESDDSVAYRRPLPPELGQLPDIPDFFFDWDNPGHCFSDCRLVFKCLPAKAPDGRVYRVCFPAWECVTRCSAGPG